MAGKYHWLAITALIAIPVVVMTGGSLAVAINPEMAAGHQNYVANFWLLSQIRTLIFRSTFVMALGLWVLCCFLLIKSKARSMWWLVLAAFGPFGLTALVILNSRAPADNSRHPHASWGRILLGAVYEIARFAAIWTAAYQCMVLWRDFLIWRQSVSSGLSVATITAQQNASSGMYAFGEGLEILFLVALSYLLWPVCVAGAIRLGRKFMTSSW